jgi:tripartite-type tricarboxylate transporter receptor subunit TctC
VDEEGLPGFDVSTWQALFAPKRTPQTVITRINAAVSETLADTTVRQRIADLLQEVVPPEQQTPGALRALQEADIKRWWPIIKAAGFKVE